MNKKMTLKMKLITAIVLAVFFIFLIFATGLIKIDCDGPTPYSNIDEVCLYEDINSEKTATLESWYGYKKLDFEKTYYLKFVLKTHEGEKTIKNDNIDEFLFYEKDKVKIERVVLSGRTTDYYSITPLKKGPVGFCAFTLHEDGTIRTKMSFMLEF